MSEWTHLLSASRLSTWDDWHNRKIKTAALSHKLNTENLCEESILRKHSAIIQSRKNINTVMYTFTNETTNWKKLQNKEGLFCNYVSWNWGYSQILDVSAFQFLETAVQHILYGTYLSPLLFRALLKLGQLIDIIKNNFLGNILHDLEGRVLNWGLF